MDPCEQNVGLDHLEEIISRTHDKMKYDICDTETCYETIISKAHSF